MTDALTIPTDAQIEEARELGRVAGRNAGSWAADGNTSADHIRRMLQWIEDGDPRADDCLPTYPNLSGEYADDPTPQSIARDIIGAHDDWYEPIDGADALADAWEEGVAETFMDACTAELRAFLPTDESEDTSEDPCTDHDLEVCPDCGNCGTAIGPKGYYSCTRFLTCWADVETGS